jgi:hypothetical protein
MKLSSPLARSMDQIRAMQFVEPREAHVNERSAVLTASVVGAVAGAVYGFLYLTERGREFRLQLEPRLDNFIAELQRLQGTVKKARFAASESWRSLNEAAGRTATH